jgi:energy-coupling factor transporter ATP-binding protein EcfA2
MQVDKDAVLAVPDHARERAEGFVGRRWVLDEISGWLEMGSERYLVITGEPGSGKTALAAWLAGAGPVPKDADAATGLARLRGGWDAVHFCVARGQRGTVDPGQFARSLAEQLAQRYDAFAIAAIDRIAPEVNISVEARENWGTVIGLKLGRLVIAERNAQDVYNRAVREPLQELIAQRPDVTVWILVDALDEALAAEGTNIVELIAGSGDLPPGVRFLLTTRREPRVLDQFDDARRLDLSGAKYAAAAEADLKTYISARLATDERLQPLPPAPDDVEGQLIRQAEGNFLYARWILDELAERKRDFTDISSLPRGLYGLYRTFLDRLVPQGPQQFSEAWLGRHEPFFGCLTVATPAAPEVILPRWLGWTKPELNVRVEEVAQVIEYVTDLPEEDRGYRLYHRSIADFLSADRYQENGDSRTNRYYVEPARQHDRIASHYLQQLRDAWSGDWTRSDSYGLRQLVGHLIARVELAEDGRRALLEDLYEVALDTGFHAAQLQKLGRIHATLADLRATLEIALEQDEDQDLVEALRCVAAFRGITRSESLSRTIFGAVAAGNLASALQEASHYGLGSTSGGGWAQVLKLYLAWEAAEEGETDEVRRAVGQTEHLASPAVAVLAEALLTRAAEALARREGDPRRWLTEFGRAEDAERLLRSYSSTTALDPDEVQRVVSEVEPQVRDLERLSAQGAAEAASARMFIDEQEDPLMDPETSAELAWSLQEWLHRIAAFPAGQALIVRAIAPVLGNPYPRYRDKALGALGTALLGSPDRLWVRRHLQAVLRAGLDDEGVTFTFDLPSILLAEWEHRGRSAPELEAYLETAVASQDVWGTSMRGLSARAAASFRQGHVDRAFSVLQDASAAPTTYAGYGVTAILALIDRCHEFGDPERAGMPLWGPGRNRSLFDMAADFAGRVYDPTFRDERLALVGEHRAWTQEVAPDLDLAQKRLSDIQDPDVRAAYQSHVSARWASSAEPAGATRLKALVPLALFDSTTLDAILGRLLALRCGELQDQHLEAIVHLTTAEFTIGRPWKLGQWR